MIPQTELKLQRRSWQNILKQAVSDPKVLLAQLDLDPNALPVWYQPDFALRVPDTFIARMQAGNPNDPLLKQVLAVTEERKTVPGFSHDPLAEAQANPVPGLLHKFRSRVLLTVTSACVVHCRYCFRRHFPYEANNPSRAQWQQALDYIQARPEITEVILSGGDPLSAPDKHLAALVSRIAALEQVHTLRIHTRFPVMVPQRICPELLAWVDACPLNIVWVLHINHPNEIDHTLRQHLALLRARPTVTLLNQSVLLRGINDCPHTLAQLSDALFSAGVLPYYVHLLDPVSGSAHFDVATERAQQLQHELQAQLPGYLVPKFVYEQPKAASKRPLPPQPE